MKSYNIYKANNERRAAVIIIILVFLAVSGAFAYKLAADSRAGVKSRNETILKNRLVEYNYALLRFYIIEKRWPRDWPELLSKPGCIRRMMPDPFTRAADYKLIEKNGQKYAVSASREYSFNGASYDILTCGADFKFVSLAGENSPVLCNIMCCPLIK